MNPCKILLEICHLAVFIKVVLNSASNLFVVLKGTSAFIIELAKDAKALSPAGPRLLNASL
jgi:hypothetical protein